MKQIGLLLLAVVGAFCAWQLYNIYVSNPEEKIYASDVLPDASEETLTIPLNTPDEYTITKARSVQKDGHNLFLISDETLFRFSRQGDFVCRITDPKDIRVAGYVVNQAKEQLIVLGNNDDIFYYSYDGKLLGKKKLKSDFSDARVLSMSMSGHSTPKTERHPIYNK